MHSSDSGGSTLADQPASSKASLRSCRNSLVRSCQSKDFFNNIRFVSVFDSNKLLLPVESESGVVIEFDLVDPPVLRATPEEVRKHGLAFRPNVAEQVRVAVVAEFVQLRVLIRWPFYEHVVLLASNEWRIVLRLAVYRWVLGLLFG